MRKRRLEMRRIKASVVVLDNVLLEMVDVILVDSIALGGNEGLLLGWTELVMRYLLFSEGLTIRVLEIWLAHLLVAWKQEALPRRILLG